MADVTSQGVLSAVARKNALVSKSFAYVDHDADNTSGTLSSHPFTLESGKSYAGIVMIRGSVVPTGVSTDQGDTVTLRGSLTGGGDGSNAIGFEFTASAASTTIQVTSISTSAYRVVSLWEVTGYTYQDSASDPSASGADSLLTGSMNSASGDVAMGVAVWNTNTGTVIVADGLDTIHATPVYTRIHAICSNGNVTGGTPESFTIGISGFKAGGALFLLYR